MQMPNRMMAITISARLSSRALIKLQGRAQILGAPDSCSHAAIVTEH